MAGSCMENLYPLPALLFFGGSFVVSLYLKRKNRLGLRDTIRAILGAIQIERDRPSHLMMLATLVLPILLWLYLGQSCPPVGEAG